MAQKLRGGRHERRGDDMQDPGTQYTSGTIRHRPGRHRPRRAVSLSLLLALVASSVLVAVAAPARVATAAGTYFTEDFTEALGEDNEVLAGLPDVDGGVVTMPSSNNNVVRTRDNTFHTASFCAQVTVAGYVGAGDNRAYLGFGPGGLAGGDGDFPQQGPAVVARSLGQFGGSFADNLTLLTSPTVDAAGTEVFNQGGQGLGTGPYTLQLSYDRFAEEVRAFADGVQFGPTVDVRSYAFAQNPAVRPSLGHVFFGGQGVELDDFAVRAGTCGSLIVTNTGDTGDTLPGDGSCVATGGGCTLRAAIEEANALAGPDQIAFDITDPGPHTISPATALPVVTETVTIDGFTQLGSSPTNSAVVTINAVPGVRLVGTGPGAGAVGLDLSASTGSTVRGLSILSFATGIAAGDGTTIAGNYIGADDTGNFGHIDGILIDGANNVVVGGLNPADRNLISGNGGGISIVGDADDNVILGNLIGTDAGGTASVANGTGIIIRSSGGADTATATGNQIGNGFLNGRNTITGNNGEGVSIGTNSSGTAILANWIGVGFGVAGATLGNNQSGTNTDSGNWGGIAIRGGTNTVIGGLGGQGNLIANNNNGVVVLSGTGNRIGGANVIRDNLDRGIVIAGAAVNDPGDVDEGANRGQNQPVLSGARIDGANVVVDFSIDTADLGAYPITVEIFEADSGASGEGARFIRRDTTTATGPGSYSIVLGAAVALSLADGDPLVAAATDAAGNTSSFSNVAVIGGSDALVAPPWASGSARRSRLEGNRMAVSAPNADVGAQDAGVVYVYERTDSGSPWVLTATIPSPSPEFGARFGNALDLRGDLLAVGESARVDEGRVWVFRLSGGVWSQVGGWIEAEGDGFGNEFGASVAWIDDDSLAIGAPGAVGGQGRVYLASLISGEGGFWLVGPPLSADFGGSPPPAGAQLGFAVAFDDSPAGDGRLVAGAPGASRRY